MTLVRPPAQGDPLRVAVVGSSAAMMVVPHRADRTEGTYGEVLADLLTDRGVPTVTSFRCRWMGMIHELRAHHEHVRDLNPHVVVLNVGMAECQPHVLPTWLVRHFTTWNPSSTAVARAYRRWVAGRLWRVLRAWQRLAARVDRGLTWRLRPARYRWELRHTIGLLRQEVRPLVLVVDIDPPGRRVMHWLPGLDRRVERYNAELADLVAALDDPEVRLVRASATVAGEVDGLLPDGFHRTAEGHRRTARLLADEICAWLEAQRLPDRGQPRASSVR